MGYKFLVDAILQWTSPCEISSCNKKQMFVTINIKINVTYAPDHDVKWINHRGHNIPWSYMNGPLWERPPTVIPISLNLPTRWLFFPGFCCICVHVGSYMPQASLCVLRHPSEFCVFERIWKASAEQQPCKKGPGWERDDKGYHCVNK